MILIFRKMMALKTLMNFYQLTFYDYFKFGEKLQLYHTTLCIKTNLDNKLPKLHRTYNKFIQSF